MNVLQIFSLKRLFLLAIAGGALWWFLPKLMPESFGLPGQMSLSNNEGRSIKAVVVARSSNHIRFMRVDTGHRFAYPIEDLSLFSRLKVMRYPATIDAPAGGADLRVMHRDGLVTERQRLQQRINDLNGRLLSESVNPNDGNTAMSLRADQRGMIREIERIHARIANVDKSLAALGD